MGCVVSLNQCSKICNSRVEKNTAVCIVHACTYELTKLLIRMGIIHCFSFAHFSPSLRTAFVSLCFFVCYQSLVVFAASDSDNSRVVNSTFHYYLPPQSTAEQKVAQFRKQLVHSNVKHGKQGSGSHYDQTKDAAVGQNSKTVAPELVRSDFQPVDSSSVVVAGSMRTGRKTDYYEPTFVKSVPLQTQYEYKWPENPIVSKRTGSPSSVQQENGPKVPREDLGDGGPKNSRSDWIPPLPFLGDFGGQIGDIGGPSGPLPPPPPTIKGSIDYILIPLILIGIAGPIFVVLYVILGAYESRLSPIAKRSMDTMQTALV